MSTQDSQDGYSGVQDGFCLDRVDELADQIARDYSRYTKILIVKDFLRDIERYGYDFAWDLFHRLLSPPAPVQLSFL